MSGENGAPAATPSPQQASELQPSATPAPADGGATPAASDVNPAPEQTPQPTPAAQPQNRSERRYSELASQRNQAREEAAYWRGIAEAKAGGQQPHAAPTPSPVAAQPAGPPDHRDTAKYPLGEYDARYAADLAKYELRQEQRAEAEATAAANANREAAAAMEAGRTRVNTAITEARTLAAGNGGEFFENAEHVLALAFVPVQRGGITRDVADAIVDCEHKNHVAELLGRRPEQIPEALRTMVPNLRELNGLPQAQLVRTLARLDDRIGLILANQRARASAQPAPAATPAPQQSPAPSPVPAPTAPNTGGAIFNPSTASPAEIDARLAELKRQRAGGAWNGAALRI